MLKRWLLVISIPLVFQVFFLIILFWSQSVRSEAQGWAIHTVEVIAQAETIGRLLNESRVDVQLRLIREDTSAGNFEVKKQEVNEEFARLAYSVRDNEKNTRVIADVKERTRLYLEWLGNANALIRQARRDEAIRVLLQPKTQVSLREIRGRMDVFLAGERKLDLQRRITLSRVVNLQNTVLLVGAVLTIALAVGVAYYFSQGFAARVAILTRNAKALAEGKALSSPLKGSDEIVQLDAVFHSMAKALAERDQENELFIYSVSHDLRSPLVNLQGFSKELTYTCDDVRLALAKIQKTPEAETKLQRLLDEDMPASIHFIQNAVSRLSAIIDSLLRLSRAGRVEYRIQEVDIQATVQRVVEALEASLKERGAQIHVDGLPSAWGDATIIEQIFANLLSNAVKYLDPARPGRIEVGVEESKGDLRVFFVRDNGLGIPKAHQNKLFLAFQRLHPSAATGEGIGLALVRRMVERLGGRIWAESDAGIGSTFFVSLPANTPDSVVKLKPQTVSGGIS